MGAIQKQWLNYWLMVVIGQHQLCSGKLRLSSCVSTDIRLPLMCIIAANLFFQI